MGKKSYVWDGTAWVVFTGTTTYPVADTSGTQGVVSLVNSTSSTSTTTAAVPASVKSSYDLAAAAVPKSTVTTAGDIIYGTGSAAVTRLGIGTAGQILTVNAGATAPEWAAAAGGGALTLIATATPSASAANISFTSIPTTYKHLQLVWRGVFFNSAQWLTLRVNNDSGSNYSWVSFGFRAGSPNVTQSTGAATAQFADNSTGYNALIGYGPTTASIPGIANNGQLVIYRYASLEPRMIESNNSNYYAADGSQRQQITGVYNSSAAAITQIDLIRNSTQQITGTFYLYGVS